MYNLITTYTRVSKRDVNWVEIDASNISITDLLKDYSDVYFIINHPVEDSDQAISVDTIKSLTDNPNENILYFLEKNGNNTLPTLDEVPNLVKKLVTYLDVYQNNVKVYLTDGFINIDEAANEDSIHLKLIKEGIDWTDIFNHSLVSVNGYLHKTDYDVNGLYIRDCASSVNIAKANNIGLYSFKDIGKVTSIAITEDMIYKREESQKYKNRIDIKLNEDIGKRTVAISIGGYLHIGDLNLVNVTGNRSIRINFNEFNFIPRYFESKEFIDMSFLGLDELESNKDLINRDELLSDEIITKYLTNSRSFIILIDNENIITNKVYVYRNGKGLMSYGAGSKIPNIPLVVGRGRLAEYITRGEWDGRNRKRYSINVSNNREDSFMYRTTTESELSNLDNAVTPAFPKWQNRSSGAYLLEIGSLFSKD